MFLSWEKEEDPSRDVSRVAGLTGEPPPWQPGLHTDRPSISGERPGLYTRSLPGALSSGELFPKKERSVKEELRDVEIQ